MRETRVWYFGAAAALAAALALASVAEAAGLVSRRELSLDLAMKMADAAIATCEKNGWNVTVVIADVHGNLKLLQRSDGAHAASIRIGIGKATTAAIFRRSTAFFQKITRPDEGAWGLQYTPGVLPLRGGLPIKEGEEPWSLA